MFPILIKVLCDDESLFEYERNIMSKNYKIHINDLGRRIAAIERLSDCTKNDAYYTDKISVQINKYKNTAELLCKMPEDVARDFLCSIGKYTYIKKSKFNLWMDIMTYIPPAIFIAGYIKNIYMGEMPNNIYDLKNFIDRYLFQFKYTAQPIVYLPELNFMLGENGLNDLHLHLNGSTESDIIWKHMLQHPYGFIINYTKKFQQNSVVRKFAEQNSPNLTPDLFGSRLITAQKLRSYICRIIYKKKWKEKIQERTDQKKGDFQLCDMFGVMQCDENIYSPIIDEILFYLYVFEYLDYTENEYIAAKFHHYLLIKGFVHRFSVMQYSQYGFSQFQLITENPIRDDVESFYKNRFLQLSSGGGKKYLGTIEGRFSPGNNKLRINESLKRIYDGFEKAQNESDDLKDVKLYLVAHFIKRKDTVNDKIISIRHRQLRTELQRKAMSLIAFFNSNSKYGKCIKGIDAAASEFDAGPEVFAPIFRFIKKNGINRCTFHAGEDFKHILSGMRYIYEAIEFLDMTHGDRLGHCTAVGISPKLWIERTGKTCFISQGEWLDDMIFLWEIITKSKHCKLQAYLPLIVCEISEFSYKIYGESYPPYLLSEAWKLRKYDPFVYIENKRVPFYNGFIAERYEDMVNIKRRFENKSIKDIMRVYHRTDDMTDMYDKIIEIECEKICTIEDMISIQGIILEYINRKGIVIESLPTSNIRISYYRNAMEYHLKDWMNCSLTNLMPPIVLGTDDPGIFTTNIFNEYARAYMHLEENSVSSHEAFSQISNIYRSSIIYKFDNQ